MSEPDITQLRDLQAKQPHLEMLRGALDRLSDSVIIADPDGVICFVNAQAELVFGYRNQELVGRKVECLLPATLHEAHAKYRSDFWRNPKVRAMGAGKQLTGITKEGREFPCEIMLSPFSTDYGRYVSAQIRAI